ncbi:hypothetical protein ACIQ4Z_23060 [Peribacillus asahii]|uniref:hypothetical protein n=1 Tax=Peribacillus asahii TaxID=228899 RepID=UPI0038249886
MIYQVRLLKGLFKLERSRYQLQNAEAVTHIGRNIVVLYVASLLLFCLYGFLGIGSESFSRELVELGESEFEMGKLLILAGNAVAGLLYPTIYLFLIALFVWALTDIVYLKVLIVQMIIFIVQLLEKLLLLPFLVYMDIDYDANPFSLGVISQYLVSQEYIIHFFSEITIFQVLVIAIQYYYLKKMTERNTYALLAVIVLSYIAIWLLNALLAYVKVSVFV